MATTEVAVVCGLHHLLLILFLNEERSIMDYSTEEGEDDVSRAPLNMKAWVIPQVSAGYRSDVVPGQHT